MNYLYKYTNIQTREYILDEEKHPAPQGWIIERICVGKVNTSDYIEKMSIFDDLCIN